MAANCAKCELTDQLRSVDSILGISAFTESQSTSVIVGSGGVTPIITNTTYENKGLESMQESITEWINEPVIRNADPKKFRKLNGWLIILAANFVPGAILQTVMGSMTDPGAMLGFLGASAMISLGGIGVGIWYLVTLKRRRIQAGLKNSPATDIAEYNARKNGWYCYRCNMLTPAN